MGPAAPGPGRCHGLDSRHVPAGQSQGAVRDGVFPPDWLDTAFMATAVRMVTSRAALGNYSLQYGEPKGDGSLGRRCRKSWVPSMCMPDPRRSLALLALRMRSTSTAAPCCAPAIAWWSKNLAGRSNLPAWPRWAYGYCSCPADGPVLDVMAQYCQLHHPARFVSISVCFTTRPALHHARQRPPRAAAGPAASVSHRRRRHR
jgi:hypothetical protein